MSGTYFVFSAAKASERLRERTTGTGNEKRLSEISSLSPSIRAKINHGGKEARTCTCETLDRRTFKVNRCPSDLV